MSHDPLCLADPATDNSRCHYCVLIAKVRQDERDKDLDYRSVAAQAEADGKRDAINACIELLIDQHDHAPAYSDEQGALMTAIWSLREMKE